MHKAELAGAHFENAELLGANLKGADLLGADFSGADLTGAAFTGADIRYVDFRGAKGVSPDQLRTAQNADLAFYDTALLHEMNLPDGNNDLVGKRRKEENDSVKANPAAAEAARLEQRSRQLGKTSEASVVIALIRRNIAGSSTLQTVSTVVPNAGIQGVHPFTVAEVMRLYDFPDNLDGSSQAIGIIELGGYYQYSDLAKYFTEQGIRVPRIATVSVHGAAIPPAGGDEDGQVELDLEVAGRVAPKAELVLYLAKNTDQGFMDAIQTAVHDTTHRLSVLLIGWGGPESTWKSPQVQAMNQALQLAVSAGITVVVASGDNGSDDGVRDGKSHVDFPASSPWALAVGGTKLLAAGNSIASEVVWNDTRTNQGATGGGVSQVFPLPEWQVGASVPRRPDGSMGRGVPDVAANASPSTGYMVLINGQATVIGGTSATAPLWAGLVALLDQGLGRKIGYLNPLLYQYAGPAGALRGITSGNNGGFSAGSGWSAATGWGSPDGQKLLDTLRALPASKN